MDKSDDNGKGDSPDFSWNIDGSDRQGMWMSRLIAEQWQLRVRLITNGYRTVMDRVEVEPLEAAAVLGIRGSIEVPTGNPNQAWTRIPLHQARMEATETLHRAITAAAERPAEWPNPFQSEKPQPSSAQPLDKRLLVSEVPALQASFLGFTAEATRPRREVALGSRQLRLALVAAAYETAAATNPRTTREQLHHWLADLGLHYQPETIPQLIHKARLAGMLTKARRGKAGGRATATAHRIIATAGLDQLPWQKSRSPRPKTPKTP